MYSVFLLLCILLSVTSARENRLKKADVEIQVRIFNYVLYLFQI